MNKTRGGYDEPTANEYAAIKRECEGLLLTAGFKGSLMWGTGAVLGMMMLSKFTAAGRKMTIHPKAILATIAFVAPFWIYGETAVTECQRSAFERRKQNIGRNFQNEMFNKL